MHGFCLQLLLVAIYSCSSSTLRSSQALSLVFYKGYPYLVTYGILVVVVVVVVSRRDSNP